MLDNGKLQSSRYEFKYLVTEPVAERLRDLVRTKLVPDQFTDPRTGLGYDVHSLYLDSPDLKLCRQTISGDKNRFKLRIRFYDDNAETPVFLEIKRRQYNAVLKTRVAVWRSSLAELFKLWSPRRHYLVREDSRQRDSLAQFCGLVANIQALPAAYTSYVREAYEPADNNFCRVTLDRQLRAGRFSGTFGLGSSNDWQPAPVDGVVLEFKFTDRFPRWMHDLAQQFNLQKISVPKYVECMNMMEQRSSRQRATALRIVVDRPLRYQTDALGWRESEDK
jgi:hypothetical protein